MSFFAMGFGVIGCGDLCIKLENPGFERWRHPYEGKRSNVLHDRFHLNLIWTNISPTQKKQRGKPRSKKGHRLAKIETKAADEDGEKSLMIPIISMYGRFT